MTTLTLEEKRLKQLKQQLFGKELSLKETPKTKLQIPVNSKIALKLSSETALLDPLSLKSDFTKIIVLSTLALVIQLSLFFANRQGFVNLF